MIDALPGLAGGTHLEGGLVRTERAVDQLLDLAAQLFAGMTGTPVPPLPQLFEPIMHAVQCLLHDHAPLICHPLRVLEAMTDTIAQG